MKLKINHIAVTPVPLEKMATVHIDIPLQEGLKLAESVDKINLGEYVVEIKRPRKSQNMNSYMWVLCGRIAEKVHHLNKEDVYKQGIRHVGKWVDVTIPKENAKDLVTGWQNNGIGWFAEFLHTGEETTSMRCYIGSSVYEHGELRRLTNFIVDEAKGLGVETMTPAELDHLEYLWGIQ